MQPDIGVGEELKPWTYHVSREDLVAYAKASGDDNPIHQNEEFAKAVGLPDVIAHGMHTMAKMAQYVGDWTGDPGTVVRFKTRFTKPVVVPRATGNDVTVAGSVASKDGSTLVLRVSAATTDGAGVAEAEATVLLGGGAR